MRKDRLFALLGCSLLWLFAAVSASAQEATGSLSGLVTDPSGAVLAGASVILTETTTSVSMTQRTNAAGNYDFVAVPPGRYILTVSAAGFGKSVVRDLTVLVGKHLIQDVKLSISQVGQQMEVSAAVNGVDTETADVRNFIDRQELDTLPLKNRDFADLATLVPQIVHAPVVDPTKVRVGNISVAGTTGRQSNVYVDGLENYNVEVGGLNYDVSPDGIEEFNVVTSHFSAEQARSMGAVINIVQRSGTNQLHGGGFYYFRNQDLAARDPFETSKSPFRRQQQGFTVGGPLLKNKFFGFVAFEDHHEHDVGIVNTNGAYPQYDRTWPLPFRRDFVTARADYVINDHNRLFYRFNLDDFDGREDVGGARDYTSGRSDATNTQSHGLGLTSVLSNTKVNTLLFGFTRYSNLLEPLSTSLSESFPDLIIGQTPGTPQSTLEHRFQLKDDYSIVFPKHTLKFGAEYNRASTGQTFVLSNNGAFTWFTDAPLNSPDADLLFQSACGTPNCNIGSIATDILGFYAQDDWKVRPNLTVNAGLRWDYYSNQNDKDFKGIFGKLIPPGSRTSDKLNFSPRIGFAYDPLNHGKLVLRAGYGMYYQNVTLVDGLFEQGFDGVKTGYQVFFNPGAISVANPFPGLTPAQIQALLLGPPQTPFVALANNIKTPYIHYWSGGLQWEFTHGMSMSLDGVHSLGVKGMVNRDVNVDQNFNVAAPGALLCQQFGNATCQLFGAFPQEFNADRLHYNALVFAMNGHFARRFEVNGSYTYSKADNLSDDNVGSESVLPSTNPFNVLVDRGPALTDQRHRIVASGMIDLSHWLPGRGWEFGVVSGFNTPLPFTIIEATAANDGITYLRPPGIGRNTGNRGSEAKTLALVNAYRASEGLAPLNRPLTPKSLNTASTSLRLSKEIAFNERLSLRLQGETFNVFNKPNYVTNSGPYGGEGVMNIADSDQLGLPRTTQGVLSDEGPRTFQFSVRFKF